MPHNELEAGAPPLMRERIYAKYPFCTERGNPDYCKTPMARPPLLREKQSGLDSQVALVTTVVTPPEQPYVTPQIGALFRGFHQQSPLGYPSSEVSANYGTYDQNGANVFRGDIYPPGVSEALAYTWKPIPGYAVHRKLIYSTRVRPSTYFEGLVNVAVFAPPGGLLEIRVIGETFKDIIKNTNGTFSATTVLNPNILEAFPISIPTGGFGLNIRIGIPSNFTVFTFDYLPEFTGRYQDGYTYEVYRLVAQYDVDICVLSYAGDVLQHITQTIVPTFLVAFRHSGVLGYRPEDTPNLIPTLGSDAWDAWRCYSFTQLTPTAPNQASFLTGKAQYVAASSGPPNGDIRKLIEVTQWPVLAVEGECHSGFISDTGDLKPLTEVYGPASTFQGIVAGNPTTFVTLHFFPTEQAYNSPDFAQGLGQWFCGGVASTDIRTGDRFRSGALAYCSRQHQKSSMWGSSTYIYNDGAMTYLKDEYVPPFYAQFYILPDSHDMAVPTEATMPFPCHKATVKLSRPAYIRPRG